MVWPGSRFRLRLHCSSLGLSGGSTTNGLLSPSTVGLPGRGLGPLIAKWRLRLVWAVLLALATTWGVKSYLTALQETEPVLIAMREIPARAALTPDMVSVVQVSRLDRDSLAPDAFRSFDELSGRNARRRIEVGEVLRNRPSDFTNPGEVGVGRRTGDGALADFLPAETRAVTLKLDQQGVMGSHIRPGDHVDVIFTSKSDATGGVYASLILQQITVLHIAYAPESEPDRDVLVTLLVTPQQAVDAALAKRTGTVDLALSPSDATHAVEARVTSPLHFVGSMTAVQAETGGR